jgi:hypothetical protein
MIKEKRRLYSDCCFVGSALSNKELYDPKILTNIENNDYEAAALAIDKLIELEKEKLKTLKHVKVYLNRRL